MEEMEFPNTRDRFEALAEAAVSTLAKDVENEAEAKVETEVNEAEIPASCERKLIFILDAEAAAD